MEVAPRYWQSPSMLDQLYVSTSGAKARGTQTTNAVAGMTTGPPGAPAAVPLFSTAASPAGGTAAANPATILAATAASIALDSARNQSSKAISSTGRTSASSGAPVSTAADTMVPLSAFSHEAIDAIHATMRQTGLPASIHGSLAGTARVFQLSLQSEPLLILAALAAVYIVLGIFYESFIHPITILSTLPSAGVGALIALRLSGQEFSIIALIAVILLIGIVKKNAIMMVDFAIDATRQRHLAPFDAILQACLLRFRPIMMTTCAALFGALPLAFGTGEGVELRHPLGISIVGGLLVSQLLTLYTTPVVYLALDRVRLWGARGAPGRSPQQLGDRRVRRRAEWRAPAPVPFAFKEVAGWKFGTPADEFDRGEWWSIYHDPTLDALERQIDVSNQTLKGVEAAYRLSQAIVYEARSGLFPVVTGNAGGSRNGSGGGSSSGVARSSYTLQGGATWDLDVWGRVRRNVESAVAGTQASAADIAAIRLSVQSTLASDYFSLRIADALQRLLNNTAKQYERSLKITENQFAFGVLARLDVITALALLQTTRAQATAAGVRRAQLEHAIATLIGRPPAELSINPAPSPRRCRSSRRRFRRPCWSAVPTSRRRSAGFNCRMPWSASMSPRSIPRSACRPPPATSATRSRRCSRLRTGSGRWARRQSSRCSRAGYGPRRSRQRWRATTSASQPTARPS